MAAEEPLRDEPGAEERARRELEEEPRVRREEVEEPPVAATGGPAPAPDWREQVTMASGLNVLAGIWLIIAPWVLGYSGGDPYWNDVAFGAAIAVLALARIAGLYRAAWLSWLNALFGLWIFVSAFWLDDTATAAWNDLVVGAIVVVLGAWSASASGPAETTTTTAA